MLQDPPTLSVVDLAHQCYPGCMSKEHCKHATYTYTYLVLPLVYTSQNRASQLPCFTSTSTIPHSAQAHRYYAYCVPRPLLRRWHGPPCLSDCPKCCTTQHTVSSSPFTAAPRRLSAVGVGGSLPNRIKLLAMEKGYLMKRLFATCTVVCRSTFTLFSRVKLLGSNAVVLSRPIVECVGSKL